MGVVPNSMAEAFAKVTVSYGCSRSFAGATDAGGVSVRLTSIASAAARPHERAAVSGAPLAATNDSLGGRDLQAA
jgi:hypothetical protein